ncbi:MAG: LPXTG cell wall anchor domain-containing protein, partial [Bacillota bacterium]|nr:LPXTG cell wall anchor domain-containing protein [Bacillota bacterium]
PNTTYNLYARLAETDTHLASPESPVTTATTLKSDQTAPAAPVVAVLTDTSITLEEITGAEYRLNDGAWQTNPEFTGLSPNTTYNLYARLAETDTHLASPESPVTTATTLKSDQTAPAAPVVVVLTDTSITLEEITGAEYRLNDGAWQTDPEFTGLSPNTTYKLYVRLAETDTHLASPESPVTTATTLKSAQTAPAAPVVATLTDTSITLEEITGAEYRLNDGAWQTDPEFTGLSPNTTYNLYARLAETDTHLASLESPATTATTLKSNQTAPAAPVVAVLTDTSITLEEITGAEYRLNDGAWQTDPEFTGLTPNTTNNLYVRLAETDTHLASPESPATTATTLKSNQTAPAAPVVATLTDTSITLEEITGAEYRLNDGAWQTDPEFTGLTPNTSYNLYVRLAETDTHLASPESPVTTVATLKSDQTEPDKTEPTETEPTETEPTETEATQPEDAIPKTGESSGHDPWLSLLLISASGLILLTRKKRMSQQRN